MTEPRWLNSQALLLLIGEALHEHGGRPGFRDQGLFELAVARPANLFHYGGETSIARLAAAYGFGLSQNHPFIDGNKRAALIAIGLFLKMNGLNLVAPQPDAFRTILRLAAGTLTEAELGEWIEANIAPR